MDRLSLYTSDIYRDHYKQVVEWAVCTSSQDDAWQESLSHHQTRTLQLKEDADTDLEVRLMTHLSVMLDVCEVPVEDIGSIITAMILEYGYFNRDSNIDEFHAKLTMLGIRLMTETDTPPGVAFNVSMTLFWQKVDTFVMWVMECIGQSVSAVSKPSTSIDSRDSPWLQHCKSVAAKMQGEAAYMSSQWLGTDSCGGTDVVAMRELNEHGLLTLTSQEACDNGLYRQLSHVTVFIKGDVLDNIMSELRNLVGESQTYRVFIRPVSHDLELQSNGTLVPIEKAPPITWQVNHVDEWVVRTGMGITPMNAEERRELFMDTVGDAALNEDIVMLNVMESFDFESETFRRPQLSAQIRLLQMMM